MPPNDQEKFEDNDPLQETHHNSLKEMHQDSLLKADNLNYLLADLFYPKDLVYIKEAAQSPQPPQSTLLATRWSLPPIVSPRRGGGGKASGKHSTDGDFNCTYTGSTTATTPTPTTRRRGIWVPKPRPFWPAPRHANAWLPCRHCPSKKHDSGRRYALSGDT